MTSNCICKKKKTRELRSSKLSFLGVLFIAILPKCPFCILAYSSAITLCSGKKIYHHSPEWYSYISIFLAVFTLCIVLYNYKGVKTIIAALLVVAGSYFLFDSEMYTGELSDYYVGAGLLLTGVWLNANMMFFYNKYFKKNIEKKFQKLSIENERSKIPLNEMEKY